MMLGMSLQANHRNSGLEISFRGNQNYLVEINGFAYPVQGNFFNTNELRPGNHRLKIYTQSNRRGYGYGPRRVLIYRGMVRTRPHQITLTHLEGAFLLNIEGFIPFHSNPMGSDCYGPRGMGMPILQFEALVQQMNHMHFDLDREELLFEVLRHHDLSSAQLRQVLYSFKFEQRRLDAAVMAYPHVIDKENIFLIMEAFNFQASRREFYRRIRP